MLGAPNMYHRHLDLERQGTPLLLRDKIAKIKALQRRVRFRWIGFARHASITRGSAESSRLEGAVHIVRISCCHSQVVELDATAQHRNGKPDSRRDPGYSFERYSLGR